MPGFVTPPWWQDPQVHIDHAEEAYSRCDQAQQAANDISMYTDGSSIDNHVRAAAVCSTTGQTKSTYLGSSSSTTNYLAELRGINLALSMAQELVTDRNAGRRVAI